MPILGNYLRLSETRLNHLLEHPDEVHAALYDDLSIAEAQRLKLGTSWHIIHFLLTASVWGGPAPLAYAVMGGYPVGPEDRGYGPVRYLRVDQVRLVADALWNISEETLCTRFDVAAMRRAGVYTGTGGDAENKDDICAKFQALKLFFWDAAAQDDAMLIYLT